MKKTSTMNGKNEIFISGKKGNVFPDLWIVFRNRKDVLTASAPVGKNTIFFE